MIIMQWRGKPFGRHRTLMDTQFFVSLLLSMCLVIQGPTGVVQGQPSSPSEFLYSFLSRAHMLSNSSKEPHLSLDRDKTTLSVYMDNWSQYELVYSVHSTEFGYLESSVPPRNMPEKMRSFALSNVAKKGRRHAGKVGGMAGWTLVGAQNGVKISRVSVAWEVKGPRSKFAITLGDIIPDYSEIWTRETDNVLSVKSSFEANKMIKIADSRTTVAAKLVSDEKNHFQLLVTIVPQNIDIYSWLRYFKEQKSVKKESPKGNMKRSEEKAVPLPKKKPKSTKKTNDELKNTPLFHDKTLLLPGKSILRLEESGLTNMRDALRKRAANSTISVGIHVENWSRFRLRNPVVEMQSGEVMAEIPPGEIDPGRQDFCVVVNSGGLSGTSGILRWTMGSQTNKVLSVMWSVPYNMHFWSTWVGVGLSAPSELPTYKEMYKKEDISRFLRKKSGQEFEFSDGEFLVITYMDGDANAKPVLHLGLVPMNEEDMASSIKKKLKMPAVKPDDFGDPKVGSVQQTSQSSLSTNSAQRLQSCLCPCGAISVSRCGIKLLLVISLLLNVLHFSFNPLQ